MEHYNSCLNTPFPFIRYGLRIGYEFSKPINSIYYREIFKDAVFKTANSFNFGIFTDIPVSPAYISLHPELYFQKNAYSSYTVSHSIAYDILINATSINMPLLVRYTYPGEKRRPYFNAGGTFTYNILNKNTAYASSISEDIIEINELANDNFYSEIQIGYSLGGGIQYNIDYRKSLFFELRYNNLYALKKEKYGNRSLQCIIGINF